jgi:putative transposase
MEVKIRSHCAYSINYHIVFCPKRRKPVLVDMIADDCKKIFQDTAASSGMEILSMEVMPDHVHIFLTAPPKLAPHIIVKRLKGVSSPILREKYPQLKRLPGMWAASYYIGTVGSVSESVVKMYIENQKGK